MSICSASRFPSLSLEDSINILQRRRTLYHKNGNNGHFLHLSADVIPFNCASSSLVNGIVAIVDTGTIKETSDKSMQYTTLPIDIMEKIPLNFHYIVCFFIIRKEIYFSRVYIRNYAVGN